MTDFENRVARAIVILSHDDFDTEAEGKDGGSKMHVGSINIMVSYSYGNLRRNAKSTDILARRSPE